MNEVEKLIENPHRNLLQRIAAEYPGLLDPEQKVDAERLAGSLRERLIKLNCPVINECLVKVEKVGTVKHIQEKYGTKYSHIAVDGELLGFYGKCEAAEGESVRVVMRPSPYGGYSIDRLLERVTA